MENRKDELKATVRISPESGALCPVYSTVSAAGADLFAYLPDGEVTIKPMERKLVSTGLKMAVPEGWEAQIRPRSGLALKNGISVLNSPGTIDSDYRGIVHVLLVNLSDKDFVVRNGDRIAQVVFSPCFKAEFEVCTSLDRTVRGAGGFGSTGI